MPLSLSQVKRHAKEYVELEAGVKVLKVSFVKRHTLFGREDIVLSVLTDDPEHPEWWVVGGSSPMNLYSKNEYPNDDVAYSLHHGILLRMMDRQYSEAEDAPAEIGYDAFISHASEDKEKLVKPLARTLDNMGFRVWYDEFELKVGDSLRQSIDRGLINSRYGIVILSPAFFAKNWPQYELNGLTAREMDGHKVILPVWHRVTKEDVLHYSPTLADRVALSTSGLSIKKLASGLADVLRVREREA